MRVISNDKLIKQRARIGNIASWIGLGVLVAGMVASFQPQFIYLSFACLAVGFIAANIGTYQIRRFGRQPRPDQALVRSLKGFDDRFTFYAWRLPSPYVLLGPNGVFVLITRDQSGRVICEGSRWRQPFRFSRVFTAMGQEGLGNPTKDLLDEMGRMERWLRDHAAEGNGLGGDPIPVQGAVVFIHPNAQLEIENSTVPVVTANKLKGWFRGQVKQQALSETRRQAMEALFE